MQYLELLVTRETLSPNLGPHLRRLRGSSQMTECPWTHLRCVKCLKAVTDQPEFELHAEECNGSMVITFPVITAEGLPVKYSELSAKRKKAVLAQYRRIQQDKCWYCERDLSQPPPDFVTAKPIDRGLYTPGFFKNPVHLQHYHYSDYTEGAVHAYCNAVLWEYHSR